MSGHLLDLSGEVCPYTFVRAKLALEELPLDAELTVIVDHAPAAKSVPQALRAAGHEIVAVVEEGPRWHIQVRKRVEHRLAVLKGAGRWGPLLCLAVLRCAFARADEPAPSRVLDEAVPSKKVAFLADKAERRSVRRRRAPRAQPPQPTITLHNVWTNESLPVVVESTGARPAAPFDALVRCHYTNQVAPMDRRLLGVVLRAASAFKARYIEIVSGFRAPKYQLMLRKKGHEVARDSEHPRGQAIDFRIPEVPTRKLLRFVRSLHLGGVGYYPESRFVHADVGRIRFWRGH